MLNPQELSYQKIMKENYIQKLKDSTLLITKTGQLVGVPLKVNKRLQVQKTILNICLDFIYL